MFKVAGNMNNLARQITEGSGRGSLLSQICVTSLTYGPLDGIEQACSRLDRPGIERN